MRYELYDRDTGNLVDTFASEREALATVRRAIDADGPESVAPWLLGRTDHNGPVIRGAALVERALSVLSA